MSQDIAASMAGRWARWCSGPACCSTRCRDRVSRAEAAHRSAIERSPVLCAGCGEVMDGRRADARYCSAACRQAAYRAREGPAVTAEVPVLACDQCRAEIPPALITAWCTARLVDACRRRAAVTRRPAGNPCLLPLEPPLTGARPVST